MYVENLDQVFFFVFWSVSHDICFFICLIIEESKKCRWISVSEPLLLEQTSFVDSAGL